jgi:diguanylate cyclase (GGDEF)-like protein
MQHLPARASIQAMDGRYTFVNQKWKLGDSPPAGDAPAGDAGLDEFRRRVAATNKPLSRVYRAGDENKWWFSTHFPIPDASGAVGMIGTVDIDITEQKTQEEKLSYLQYYDALTGLPNATLLQERLDRQLQSPGGERTALVALNVNRFGAINESLGHDAGDQLLRELASRLRAAWPEPDKLARLGEDRFAGLLASSEGGADIAPALANLLKKALALPFKTGGNELTITLSAGISLASTDGSDAGSLLRNAQTALKQARMQSIDCAYYQSTMNRVVTEALMMENKLRRAIANGHFDLHYQPKINLASGAIAGVEALLRWNDPDLGFVPPMRFIPVLEETGLIMDVGAWVVRRAAADYRSWTTDGLNPPRIAVNVSALQLAQKDFLEVMRIATDNMEDGAHGLDIEITESLLMSDVGGNIAKLRAMQEAGFKVSVDDFGTGYSSLAYLTKLPVNALKIDRSFIVTMTAEADDMAIVSTIISLAHSLGLTVVAEGVETQEQKRLLKLLRCEELQGYVMFRPMPGQQLRELLKTPGAVHT